MLRLRCRSIVTFGVAVALLGLTACAVVDQYSGRTITYNLQAEQAQQQVLLLNIVRASLRRPMQFTGLQTITGTASASGSINAGNTNVHQFPAIGTPANTVIARTITNTLGGTASVSGGPTFSVPVLDTQEFYQGLLSPISGQLLDLYLQAGYPRDVLFNLTIERIILKRLDGPCRPEVHTPDCELVIRNYVTQDLDLELFQAMLGYFIYLGLSTEPVLEAPTKQAKGGGTGGAAPADSTPKLKPFAFCFSPRDRLVYRRINHSVLCGHPGTAVQLKTSEIGRKAVISGVPLDKQFIDALYARTIAPRLGQHADVSADEPQLARDLGADGFRSLQVFAGKKVSVSFNTRSIEEILYYLGEIVRRSTQTQAGIARSPVQVRVGPPQNQFPIETCPFEGQIDQHRGYGCRNLFVVETGVFNPNGLSVDYEGVHYSISANTDLAWSMPVLDIVKQLLAVNTSAKQLPASNLISVISNQ